MDWLTKFLPKGSAEIKSERKTLVRMNKVNVHELEVCHPKGIQREQPFWKPDRIDFYHLWSDGTIKHTPG